MGIVILPLAALIFALWAAAVIGSAIIAAKIASYLPYSKFTSPLLFILVCLLGLYIPNKNGIRDQQYINSIAKECGWRINNRVSDIDGVYAEAASGLATSIPEGFLAEIYGTVEYKDNDGIIRKIGAENHGEANSPSRTFRYGFRYDRKSIEGKITRHEEQVIDFERNIILARGVTYQLNDDKPESFTRHAINLLTIQAKPCGFYDSIEARKVYMEVLQPKKR